MSPPAAGRREQIHNTAYTIYSLIKNNDAGDNSSKEAIVADMYPSVLKSDEDTGAQYTWTQLRSSYANLIQSELDTFNTTYANFLANEK